MNCLSCSTPLSELALCDQCWQVTMKELKDALLQLSNGDTCWCYDHDTSRYGHRGTCKNAMRAVESFYRLNRKAR